MNVGALFALAVVAAFLIWLFIPFLFIPLGKAIIKKCKKIKRIFEFDDKDNDD